jgi:hypothetical protein
MDYLVARLGFGVTNVLRRLVYPEVGDCVFRRSSPREASNHNEKAIVARGNPVFAIRLRSYVFLAFSWIYVRDNMAMCPMRCFKFSDAIL